MFVVNILFLWLNLGWGFSAHQDIAVQVANHLPEELQFIKKEYLEELMHYAVAPDMRRHSTPGESCRHFTDYDHYLDSHQSDTLAQNGDFGCAIPNLLMKTRSLAYLFAEGDTLEIIKAIGEICHYAADICVPLHATSNYDGQLTGQLGIHALWETTVYELFPPITVPRVELLELSEELLWFITSQSYTQSKEVLENYDECIRNCSNPYGLILRNQVWVKSWSAEFLRLFLELEKERINKRFELSVNLAYTCVLSAFEAKSLK